MNNQQNNQNNRNNQLTPLIAAASYAHYSARQDRGMSICAWCNHWYDPTGHPVHPMSSDDLTISQLPDADTSHGMCTPCGRRLIREEKAKIVAAKSKCDAKGGQDDLAIAVG